MKGVCWVKREKRFGASIGINGNSYSLGYYESENDAGWIYNYFAKVHFGEFAVLNDVTVVNVEELENKIKKIENRIFLLANEKQYIEAIDKPIE